MYLLITHLPDQNPILFSCRSNMRSNHVAPPRIPQHTLKLSLFLLNTLLLLSTLHLLITPLLKTLLLLNTLLLLLLNMHTP
jgi:hypothetical protein